jgi:hypothetical protein
MHIVFIEIQISLLIRMLIYAIFLPKKAIFLTIMAGNFEVDYK